MLTQGEQNEVIRLDDAEEHEHIHLSCSATTTSERFWGNLGVRSVGGWSIKSKFESRSKGLEYEFKNVLKHWFWWKIYIFQHYDFPTSYIDFSLFLTMFAWHHHLIWHSHLELLLKFQMKYPQQVCNVFRSQDCVSSTYFFLRLKTFFLTQPRMAYFTSVLNIMQGSPLHNGNTRWNWKSPRLHIKSRPYPLVSWVYTLGLSA